MPWNKTVVTREGRTRITDNTFRSPVPLDTIRIQYTCWTLRGTQVLEITQESDSFDDKPYSIHQVPTQETREAAIAHMQTCHPEAYRRTSPFLDSERNLAIMIRNSPELTQVGRSQSETSRPRERLVQSPEPPPPYNSVVPSSRERIPQTRPIPPPRTSSLVQRTSTPDPRTDTTEIETYV